MKKKWKQICTSIITLATVFSAFPVSQVKASEKDYFTDGKGKVGTVINIDNNRNEQSRFEEGWLTVESETAYCIDINTDFQTGYKTRYDATTKMTANQISDVALSLEYVKQYTKSHGELSDKQVYLLEQCLLWRVLSEHLNWNSYNVRADYSIIPEAIQSQGYAEAKAFAKENRNCYNSYGYIYVGKGQDLGQFWTELAVGNAKLQKLSSNVNITDNNDNYSIAGATYGVYTDEGCQNKIATLTTDRDGNSQTIEVKANTVYIKEQTAPKGFQLDKTVYPLTIKAGETATLNVSDSPMVTDTLVELFKIDTETGKAIAQGNASLEGAEFVWNYYDGYYTKETLPEEATHTWTTKTIAEKDSKGVNHYVTKLADKYKVSGDKFYTQNGKNCLPLGTITVLKQKAPNGYLLENAYMQANGSTEQIKGVYVAQVTEDGELAVLVGSNQFSVSDMVVRGGVKIQKRDLETKDTKVQGSGSFKDTEFTITSLNDNPVLVDGKSYNKNEVVKTIHADIEGLASTSIDTLPYGKYQLNESKPVNSYLLEGIVTRDFEIKENGKIVDLTDIDNSIYNQVKHGDIEGVKVSARTHKRLADIPFKTF